MNFSPKPRILENCISVKEAAEYSGYSQQYIRRMLRTKKLVGLNVGQLWLIEIDSFEWYLVMAGKSRDRRFGPKLESMTSGLEVYPVHLHPLLFISPVELR